MVECGRDGGEGSRMVEGAELQVLWVAVGADLQFPGAPPVVGPEGLGGQPPRL